MENKTNILIKNRFLHAITKCQLFYLLLHLNDVYPYITAKMCLILFDLVIIFRESLLIYTVTFGNASPFYQFLLAL